MDMKVFVNQKRRYQRIPCCVCKESVEAIVNCFNIC